MLNTPCAITIAAKTAPAIAHLPVLPYGRASAGRPPAPGMAISQSGRIGNRCADPGTNGNHRNGSSRGPSLRGSPHILPCPSRRNVLPISGRIGNRIPSSRMGGEGEVPWHAA